MSVIDAVGRGTGSLRLGAGYGILVARMQQTWTLRAGLWSVTLSMAVFLTSGCGECGRRLFFFTTVRDSSNAVVEAATVAVDCVDAHDGSHLSDMGTTDRSGQASPAVHAPNRSCPEDPEAHASYFQSCSITVQAQGFRQASRALSGADLDALPKEGAGQAGHGVRVEITLTR